MNTPRHAVPICNTERGSVEAAQYACKNALLHLSALAFFIIALLLGASSAVLAQDGLLGDYYQDPGDGTFFNTLVFSRTDATVNFNFGTGSPGTGVGIDDFSIRWTGQVTAPVTGEYIFTTESDDGARLWVSGQQIVDSFVDQGPTKHSGKIFLIAGGVYDIRMDYYENGGGAVARLFWTRPGQSEEIIPMANLRLTPENIVATPEIAPKDVLFSDSLEVTITSATEGATIRYTTDGTLPTSSSTIYTGPFTISDNTTVSARAFADGMEDSSFQTVVFNKGDVCYPTGFADQTTLVVNGNAQFVGGIARLTEPMNDQEGSLFSVGRVDVTRFVTSFTFQLVPGSATPADGMTFTIQNNTESALGGGGGALGYSGIGNSVAVKFDIFDGGTADPSNSTIGLFTNGTGTAGGVDTLPSGIDLREGHVMRADIVYDGTELTLTLTDTETGESMTQAFTVDIPAVVGADRAYIGFTAATGGLNARQDVHNWIYSEGNAVSGTVTLEDCDNSAGEPITLEFRPTNGDPILTRCGLIGADGSYITAAPPGDYDVWIKAPKWLAETTTADTTGGPVTGVNVTLLGGDANNDNGVDVFDLDVLIQSFDADPSAPNWLNGAADFNCDESVDVFDLDILIRNFDELGAP
jgi:hypothetical protein